MWRSAPRCTRPSTRTSQTYLPGVPYVDTLPALAFKKTVVGFKPSPTLNDNFELVQFSAVPRDDRSTLSSRRISEHVAMCSASPSAGCFCSSRSCLGLSILIFGWLHALPGSPAESLLGERATPQSVAQIRTQLGLDRPIYVQYWRYVQTVGGGDLGTSIASRRAVTDEIEQRFPATIELTFAAGIIAVLLGIPIGFMTAKHYGTLWDHGGLRLLAGRHLDADLLPRADPEVHLRGEARLVTERRPPGRADRRPAPDELLRPRRHRHRQLDRRLGRASSTWSCRRWRSRRSRSRSSRASRARRCSTSRTRTTSGRRGPRAWRREPSTAATSCATRCCR